MTKYYVNSICRRLDRWLFSLSARKLNMHPQVFLRELECFYGWLMREGAARSRFECSAITVLH